MKRGLLILLILLVPVPLMVFFWLTMTQAGLQWSYHQAKPYLPAELSINNIQGKLFGPITLTDLEYKTHDTVIRSRQIIVDWKPVDLLLTQIDIHYLHIQSLNIVLPDTEQNQPPQNQILSLPEINLPWHITLNNAVIESMSLTQNEQTYDVDIIKLNARSTFNKIDIDEFSVSADTYNIKVMGKLYPTKNYRHDLKINWQAELPSRAIVKGSGSITGNVKKNRLKQKVSGPLQLTLDAEFYDLLNQLNWQASIDVSHFETLKLHSDLPAISGALKLKTKGDLSTASITGNLDALNSETGNFDTQFKLQRLSDNTIQIDQLNLHAPRSNTKLNASGQWLPASNGGNINLKLDWQNLRWPMLHSAWFDSAHGEASIEGNAEHYKINLTTDSPWPEAAPSTWVASAEGNREELRVQSLQVKALKGVFNASGQLNWSSELNWAADIKATNIDPASLWPQWPGQLKANINTKGHLKNGELFVDTDITKLTGTLRKHPVSLRTRMAWHENNVDISFFDFQSGDSKISAMGQLGDKLKLNWDIKTQDLSELYPLARGQLLANGQINGTQNAPIVNATINASSLKLSDYEVGAVNGTLNIDLFKWQQLNIQLSAQSLKLNEYFLQSLDINSNHQQLQVKALAEKLTAQLELNGTADENGWSGMIERFDIQSAQYDNWQLRDPVSLNITNKSFVTGDLCLHNSQHASLCASTEFKETDWQSSLVMQKFPLKIFNSWLPPDIKFDGLVNATARLRQQIPNQLLGNILIDLPEGAVNYPLLQGEFEHWKYHSGKIEIIMEKKQTKANASLSMDNGDNFLAWVQLPEASLLDINTQQQKIIANIKSEIHNLGLIEAIIPEIQELRGDVKFDFNIDGTLAQPNLYGQADLLNGSLKVPGLGLKIENLNIIGVKKRSENFNFQLDALSGDGNISVQGQTVIDKDAGWPTEISIAGNQFTASHIPEAHVHISPDLKIKLHKNIIDIKGKIHIPYAKLQPKDITTAARVSDDVVIIGGEQTVEQKWAIFTKTRLTLGDRVSFYGFGFEGRLGGNLLLEDEPGQPSKATGEINIPEGRYRAYGQRLDIEHGRLLYTRSPLTNPGLDLRAVRRINDVTAGFKIKGSLAQPQLELFSTPAMGQTETLSYLILGRPLENTSGKESSTVAKATLALSLSGGDYFARVLGDQFGLDEARVESHDDGDQASLVVGRYLSPKLYVSYGVGLIESFNTLTVRYQISDKWQLKAESGEAHGADIIYTIQR
ncbi:MAG: translocation/assembly module TamB domain-containing protein [Gammaproteobacteria bacterium]|nr:translocation/assembly module TamB domain-containing protein [Gammaproteobacteria bacterium]